jgi:hypothetical protein
MLRRAYTSNTSLNAIDCINPDAGVAEKLKSALGFRAIRLYDSIEDYLAD